MVALLRELGVDVLPVNICYWNVGECQLENFE